MQQAGFNVVRIGEFAWSTEEPSERQYTLDWLDRAIAAATRHHLQVVLCTPTDAPPAWLTRKYPQTLGTDSNGQVREHGNRRQFNYANPLYRDFTRRIVAELGRRFGHNPAVIGWQIGNEYTDESFDPETRRQFQQFLQRKYGTLGNLNRRWATAYWSQTYTDWDQTPLAATSGNPALLLEHKHFVTATWSSFQQNQIDALRPRILPTQFLTTNIGGLAWSDNWDHYRISDPLTFASWDDYVGQGHLNAPKNAMLNDFVRGWKRKNFWVMETKPASVNWAPVSNALAPGETSALAWQAIGHGADAILYWQWRAALGGQEQYHGTLVGPDGQPDTVYAEIAHLGHDLALTREALAGTSPQAEVALLHTYASRWAIDFQPHTRNYDQQAVLLRFYTLLQQEVQRRGGAVDIIDPSTPGDLSGYRLIVVPSLNVIDEPLAAKLLTYVQQGGHLILGPRSGMKNADNALNPQRQPGPLADALGAKVEQFYALDAPVALTGRVATLSPDPHADTWAEPLSPTAPDTKVTLRFGPDTGWLAEKPAMVVRPQGQGTISYLGALPNKSTLHRILFDALFAAGMPPGNTQLPEGVELCLRTAGAAQAQRRVVILINHNNTSATAIIPGQLEPLLPDAQVKPAILPTLVKSTSVTLPPQGVQVLLWTR